jgi:hypothetical protein
MDTALKLSRAHIGRIVDEVERYSGFPVVWIGVPRRDESPPAGAVEVFTMKSATCHTGEGETFWVVTITNRLQVIRRDKVVGWGRGG